jgi:predicted nucleic acid-binding protein
LERNEIPRYVPDASVAVKWFVDEEGSEHARELKEFFAEGKVDLEAPTLLTYEVASAIRFHPVVTITQKQFEMVMGSLDGLQITRDPTRPEWTAAHTLTLENPISIYDSIYLSFATRSNSIMVTADAALIKKIKKPQTKQRLLLLADLSL